MKNAMAKAISASDIDEADFWSCVDRRSTTECWPWLKKRNKLGYGVFGRNGNDLFAHRVSCVLSGVPLTVYQVVDHLCRNPRCVNPDHLEPTTVQINTARGNGPTAESARARLVGLCVNRHVLSEVGLYRQRNGWTCAECSRERVRRYKARKARAA